MKTSSEERVARQPKMNVKLLRRVKRHILAEPKRYFQNDWLTTDILKIGNRNGGQVPPCGTQGCIAGWACVLDGMPVEKANGISRFRWMGLFASAQRRLKLTKKQATRLFAGVSNEIMDNEWPERFQKRYMKSKTPRGRANAAAARIDHFIKTNGAE